MYNDIIVDYDHVLEQITISNHRQWLGSIHVLDNKVWSLELPEEILSTPEVKGTKISTKTVYEFINKYIMAIPPNKVSFLGFKDSCYTPESEKEQAHLSIDDQIFNFWMNK